MTYRIEALEENIVRFSFSDSIDDEMAEKFAAEMKPYVDKASTENPLYLLSGESAHPQATRKARQTFVQIMKDPRIARIAITQTNPFIKVLTTFIVKAAGRGEIINFFSTEDECLEWLKKESELVASP